VRIRVVSGNALSGTCDRPPNPTRPNVVASGSVDSRDVWARLGQIPHADVLGLTRGFPVPAGAPSRPRCGLLSAP
jgi:hypothetical protein